MKQLVPTPSKERTTKTHGLPNLRLLRQRKGLSLGQLAEMTGLRRNTIAHLEDGREDPQPYHLRLLARVLDVPTLDLVSKRRLSYSCVAMCF
jgi:transcriptional regulator with XRE-family HTH domain